MTTEMFTDLFDAIVNIEDMDDAIEMIAKLIDERDSAIADIPHECYYCAGIIDCENIKGTCENWRWRGSV